MADGADDIQTEPIGCMNRRQRSFILINDRIILIIDKNNGRNRINE